MHDDFYILRGRKKERLRQASRDDLARKSPIMYEPRQLTQHEIQKLGRGITEAFQSFRLAGPDDILSEAIEKAYSNKEKSKLPYKSRMSYKEYLERNK